MNVIFPKDNYVWGPWTQKFAWYPTNVGNRYIWLRRYYERLGSHFFFNAAPAKFERTTSIFEVLKCS